MATTTFANPILATQQVLPTHDAGGVTLTVSQSGSVFTNEGSSGYDMAFTLPAAAEGIVYTFYVQAVGGADGITVTAQAGDTIRIGADVSATGGNAHSATVGAALTLKAINATEWIATESVTTWTVT